MTEDGDMEFIVRAWDVNDWTVKSNQTIKASANLEARDMCYDPIADKIYGVFQISNGSGDDANAGYKLCTLDVKTMSITPITPLYFQQIFVALAVSPEGRLYGIDTSGNFYEFDLRTGVPSQIGNVGFTTQSRRQSATFDQRTGKMYWWAYMYSEYDDARVKRTLRTGLYDTGIYEVDPTTGKATLIHKMEARDQITGLYVLGGDVKQEYDLKIELTVPEQIKVNETGSFLVTVKNLGMTNASDYTINLIGNNRVVASIKGDELAPDAEKSYTLTYTATVADPSNSKFYAQLVDAKDDVERNNVTPLMDVKILQLDLASVDLQGRLKDGTVTLMWEAPDLDEPVTDGAEVYAPFIIDGIGDWTMYDGDKAYGQSFSSMGGEHSFPYAHAQKSFQVFNPLEAGLDLNPYYNEDGDEVESEFLPHTGDQVFASFYSAVPDNSSAGGHYVQSDDWMISPELSGKAQTIKFWGKSYHSMGGISGTPIDYAEKMLVYYSMTDTDPESFTVVGDTITVPVKWTEFTFDVPEGAKHFAINCVSDDQFFLFIDDITYQGVAATLTGFNVYRNGELVETIEATDEDVYTYVEELNGTASYNVTAVYAEGESGYSNTLTFTNGQTLLGDVNLDGQVNATDVAIVVDIIAGLQDAEDYDGRADVSGDDVVNATDISAITNIIAGITEE